MSKLRAVLGGGAIDDGVESPNLMGVWLYLSATANGVRFRVMNGEKNGKLVVPDGQFEDTFLPVQFDCTEDAWGIFRGKVNRSRGVVLHSPDLVRADFLRMRDVIFDAGGPLIEMDGFEDGQEGKEEDGEDGVPLVLVEVMDGVETRREGIAGLESEGTVLDEDPFAADRVLFQEILDECGPMEVVVSLTDNDSGGMKLIHGMDAFLFSTAPITVECSLDRMADFLAAVDAANDLEDKAAAIAFFAELEERFKIIRK
jgi:hypothetical protein